MKPAQINQAIMAVTLKLALNIFPKTKNERASEIIKDNGRNRYHLNQIFVISMS